MAQMMRNGSLGSAGASIRKELSADMRPDLGTPLAVGRLVARVERWLDVGFAVQFLVEQEPKSLEEPLRLVDA